MIAVKRHAKPRTSEHIEFELASAISIASMQIDRGEFEFDMASQQVVSKAYDCCEIACEHVAFVACGPVSRIANTRTKTGISASVSKGQFWALVFISAVTRASGAIRPQ